MCRAFLNFVYSKLQLSEFNMNNIQNVSEIYSVNFYVCYIHKNNGKFYVNMTKWTLSLSLNSGPIYFKIFKKNELNIGVNPFKVKCFLIPDSNVKY